MKTRTITLNISPETEAHLGRASLAGVPLPQFVAETVEREALPHPSMRQILYSSPA